MKAVFLDRDGVINYYPGDFQYVKSWQEFRFIPGAGAALKRLSDAGFRLFVISNQAGVSKGIYPQSALDLITRNMLAGLGAEGAKLDGIFYCTHQEEEGCRCRKPKTGLIDRAIASLQDKGETFEPVGSYFVGDTMRDMETGKSAGLATVLVFSGKEKPENRHSWSLTPDITAKDLPEAAELIIRLAR